MTPLELTRISSEPDDVLMLGSGADFAERLQQRAHAFGVDLYDPSHWERTPLPPELAEQRLIFYLRRRSWAEWYFGTVTPARQILLLGERQPALDLRIARQIQDEVRHHDAFAEASRKLGGEWRVESFPEPPNLLAMRDAQVAATSAGELAAANQLAGEVVLLLHGQTQGNILYELVDSSVFELMQDIETDEPAHVQLGHDIAASCATTPGVRRAMAAAQERFLDALAKQHTRELEQLGARRRHQLPGFAGAEQSPTREVHP
jgi:hypothetical protein